MKRTESATDGPGLFDESDATSISRRERMTESVSKGVVVPFRVAWSDWRTKTGLLVMASFVAAALLTSAHVAGYEVLNAALGAVGSPWELSQPSSIQSLDETWRQGLRPFEDWRHPLGTDPTGRDLLSAILWSTPSMLQMIAAGGVFSSVMATVVGTVAGYKRGRVESVLMTLTDVAMAIPGIPLVIVIVAILRPESPYLVGIIITINVWAGLARTVHSQVLSLREQSYVEASRTMGTSTARIIRKDILPNLMPYVMVNFVYASRRVIYDSVALYFLGFLPVNQPNNWGVMMNWAYQQFGALTPAGPRYVIVVPMIPIVLLSLGLILLSQGTDRLFNPRVRTRHEGESVSEADETDERTVQTGIQ
ncbi:ABC transporter permease [Halosimplex salinum]|uniref:ABC transporter permease n=1 Tax=Halosimplex salinum TaxID=1710538 RepID=UPI000F480033|nr:ABC transporter permease [Halosimplex salinum]